MSNAAAMSPANDAALGQALAGAVATLTGAGVASPRLDARLLAARVLGWDQARVLARPEHAMTGAQRASFESLVRRRARREPMAHILGRREFWGLDFQVTPATLVPRPETETIVERALAHVDAQVDAGAGGRDAELAVLDLGTGTGCLLLSLLHELPRARGLGVDVSADALAVARVNAARLGLAGRAGFRDGDWAAGIAGRFDLIVANPPYIADGDFAGLEPEVAGFEPRLALSGGADGLACHRRLLAGVGRLMADGAALLVEIGAGQADAVTAIAASAASAASAGGHGLRVSAVHRDLAGHPRVLQANRIF